jgi:hypothetical protein
MDSVRSVVECRVIRRVKAEAHDLSSNNYLVMFDEKQRFSESAQDWQTQVMRKSFFTQTVESRVGPSISSRIPNQFYN